MGKAVDTLYILVQLAMGHEGRTRAFTKIWTIYGRNLKYYISQIIAPDTASCDDVFQEVMMKVYEKLDQFDPRYPFKPWLYSVARNHCINFIKNRKNQVYLDDCDIFAARKEDGPEWRFMKREIRCAIDRCMETLDSDDAQIAFLRFYEEMKCHDIARIMDININTVKTKMRAIKGVLRHALKDII